MCSCNVALNTFATISLLVATVFWLWAVLTTWTHQFDLGIISFLLVMLSSLYLLSPWGRSPDKAVGYVVPGTHLIVALNYIFGAVRSFGFHTSSSFFGSYCVILAFLWLLSTHTAWDLMQEVVPEQIGEANVLLDDGRAEKE